MRIAANCSWSFVCCVSSCVYFCYLTCIVLLCVCVCIAVIQTLVAGLRARSQYSEGPSAGHLDTGFSWFPCVYKQMLRWFPRFQVATSCFSCSPSDLNFLDPYFAFMYMHNNHYHRATAHLQLNLLLLYSMYVSCHRHFFLVLLLNQR